MGMMAADTRFERALAWARLHVTVDEVEPIRQSPWGATIRLTDKAGLARYLKVFPSDQRGLAEAVAAIAAVIPDYAAPIVAKDELNGFLLSQDHGAHAAAPRGTAGTDLILQHYAALQAGAARSIDALAAVERFDPDRLMARLDAFLALALSPPGQEARLADFLGLRYAGMVAEAIAICRKPLLRLLAAPASLPATLNHCDLHAGNVGFDAAGACKFHDWDNALVGPAGLSLSGVLGSAAEILATHFGLRSRDDSAIARMAAGYIDALVAEGYATAAQIDKAIAGSALAGLLIRLVNYAPYPPASEQDRRLCAGDLGGIVADLLECCQILASRDRKRTVGFAALLSRHQVHDKLYGLMLQAEQSPDDADLAGIEATSGAIIRQVGQLAHSTKRAWEPETVPALQTDRRDWLDEGLFALQADVASQMFADHGTLALVNAFPPQLLSQCLAQYLAIGGSGSGTPLKVGDKRFMEPLSVRGAFNTPELYAQPLLMRLFDRVLGPDFVIGSMTIVVSKPGSEPQHLHIDHPHLFGDTVNTANLPPHAVTVLIPLVDIDTEIGGTEVIKGSHRVPFAEGKHMPRQSQTLPLGGCLMFDYRLFHGGLPNRSDRDRPVLSIVYHRAWFRDSSNFSRLHPLQVPAHEFEVIPESVRGLFQNASVTADSNR